MVELSSPISSSRTPLSLNTVASCAYKDSFPQRLTDPYLPCTHSGDKGDVGALWDGASQSKLHCDPHLSPSAQTTTNDLPASEVEPPMFPGGTRVGPVRCKEGCGVRWGSGAAVRA